MKLAFSVFFIIIILFLSVMIAEYAEKINMLNYKKQISYNKSVGLINKINDDEKTFAESEISEITGYKTKKEFSGSYIYVYESDGYQYIFSKNK
ncbi:MAG: hypothetical protein H7A30_06695 [Thermotogae bacterium]|nr:hypothetical protein [Thermotogota bacterium]